MKIYKELMQNVLCLTFQTAFKTECIVKKKTLIIFIILIQIKKYTILLNVLSMIASLFTGT